MRDPDTAQAVTFGTIRAVREALIAKRVTPFELIQATLERVRLEDEVLRAWVYVDAEAALSLAESIDPDAGPLAGVPFGVKDVIDVRGMPTRHGVEAPATPAPSDAWCVAIARAAGAIPIGKLATTPFAFRDPPAPTRNPWDANPYARRIERGKCCDRWRSSSAICVRHSNGRFDASSRRVQRRCRTYYDGRENSQLWGIAACADLRQGWDSLPDGGGRHTTSRHVRSVGAISAGPASNSDRLGT